MSFLYLIITAVVVSGDQVLKHFIATNYEVGEVHQIIPGILSFNYLQNSGAAWNILTGQMWLFYIISAIAIFVCLYYLFKANVHSKLFKFGIALVLGGIIGNLIDRIHLKYVIDMIQVDFIHFNIFNLADSAITIGIVLVFIYLLFFDESDKN
ncbi:signal peptidase II [Lactobacillus sp. M0403]|uniref:signal peptidase II n=1 Tax=Lactobacillus sp. M0403 TaxID=2751031 RepID=UPI0018DCCFF2|nr:signal peptidase II [Lactobacillus sp. M0403]MBI0092909.1 signal peptidase II [Lactobacillus sp. M0403]